MLWHHNYVSGGVRTLPPFPPPRTPEYLDFAPLKYFMETQGILPPFHKYLNTWILPLYNTLWKHRGFYLFIASLYIVKTKEKLLYSMLCFQILF